MGTLINIPYIKQPTGSAKCGAACAAMIIKYYKDEKVSVDEIWEHVSAESPEFKRQYCRTFKIGAYISDNHFPCCIIRYESLRALLEFCNLHGIAPIVNHRSFEDNHSGHFSIVKNLANNTAVINDPENKNRKTISLAVLEKAATRNGDKDEIGGNTAIIPIAAKFSPEFWPCPNCGCDLDVSFTRSANKRGALVAENLCLNCDSFFPVSEV